MTSLIAADGSGRSTSVIPAVPAAWSVTTIAFIRHLLVFSFSSLGLDYIVHHCGGDRAGARTGSLGPVSRAPDDTQPERRLTARGAATRARIVAAAVDLMYVKGVNAITLDDVRAASSTSKSQLYNHFPDKDELVRAVV